MSIELSQMEMQFIVDALDQEVKRTGLVNASLSLMIVGKLQTASKAVAEAQRLAAEAEAAKEDGPKAPPAKPTIVPDTKKD